MPVKTWKSRKIFASELYETECTKRDSMEIIEFHSQKFTIPSAKMGELFTFKKNEKSSPRVYEKCAKRNSEFIVQKIMLYMSCFHDIFI